MRMSDQYLSYQYLALLRTNICPSTSDVPKYAANVRDQLQKDSLSVGWFVARLPRYCPNESLRQSIIDALESTS